MLRIELTTKCNFSCYFCDSRLFKDHYTLDNYYNIIDQAADLDIKYLELTPSDGEIFTDKDIINKLKYAVVKIPQVMFYTNFGLCTPDIIDQLKNIKLDIRISDYGCDDQEIFEYMTRTKSFDKYKNNLKYADEVGLEYRLYKRLPDENIFYDNTNQDIDDKYKSKNMPIKEIQGVCSYQYFPRIMANGDFVLCSCSGGILTLEPEMIIGNITNTSLKELLYNKKRKEFYINQKDNNYTNYCLSCPMFSTTDIKPNINSLKRIINVKDT